MRRVLLLVASIALLATAVPAFGRAAVAGERAETERARVRELAIVRNMVVLSTDMLDELNAAVLADYGIDLGPVPDPDVRATALAEIRPMLDGFEATGNDSSGFIAVTGRWLNDVEGTDAAETDLRFYWSLATEGLEGASRVSGDSSIAAIVRLSEASIFPRMLLNGALDAELVLGPPLQPAPNRAGYYADAPDWIAGGAGQLFEEEEALPFWVFEGEGHFEAELDAIERSIAASDLPRYDAWVASLADGVEPVERPMDLSAHATQTATLSRSLDAALITTFDEERRSYEAAAGRADRDRRLYLGGGIAGLVLGSILLVPTAGDMVRRRRRLARAAQTDPLTGAANRRVLETVVPELLADRTFVHHQIGVIDLDKFKLINDSYGHQAGDTVLCEFVRRMERALVMWTAEEDSKRRAQLVRLGGDEFVFSLHSVAPIDPRRVDGLIRGTVEHPVRFEDDIELPLAFSLGLARCDGQAELGAAQAAADLAAYENKRTRSGAPTGPAHELKQALQQGQAEQGQAHPNDHELAKATTTNDEITLTG